MWERYRYHAREQFGVRGHQLRNDTCMERMDECVRLLAHGNAAAATGMLWLRICASTVPMPGSAGGGEERLERTHAKVVVLLRAEELACAFEQPHRLPRQRWRTAKALAARQAHSCGAVRELSRRHHREMWHIMLWLFAAHAHKFRDRRLTAPNHCKTGSEQHVPVMACLT